MLKFKVTVADNSFVLCIAKLTYLGVFVLIRLVLEGCNLKFMEAGL